MDMNMDEDEYFETDRMNYPSSRRYREEYTETNRASHPRSYRRDDWEDDEISESDRYSRGSRENESPEFGPAEIKLRWESRSYESKTPRERSTEGERYTGASIVMVNLIHKGRPFLIEVREDTTVREFRADIYRQTGIPMYDGLVFDGKHMEDERPLYHYKIGLQSTIYHLEPGSTFASSSFYPTSANPHRVTESFNFKNVEAPVREDFGESFEPVQSMFGDTEPGLTWEESKERMESLWAESDSTGLDADTHIIDPVAHYSHLECLEATVVRNSEFFRCQGIYNCEDDSFPDISQISETGWDRMNIAFTLRTMLPQYFQMSQSESRDNFDQDRRVLESLWKSYWVISRTLASLKTLRSNRFCTSFYSMFVTQPNTDEAYLARISLDGLHRLQSSLEHSIIQIFAHDPEGREFVLSSNIAVQCDEILSSTGIFDAVRERSILTTCRAIVFVLDLALVSYVGSHGSRFTAFLNSEMDSIEIKSNNHDIPIMKLILQPLACLSGFLDNIDIWMFTCQSKRGGRAVPSRLSDGMSVLTRMEEFSDIWGPVWSVPGDGYDADQILQYNLSRGFIRPIPGGESSSGIACHWYTAPLTDFEEAIMMDSQALLSIGGALIENRECQYTLNHFEDDYGYDMGQLGTARESWQLDARTLGITMGKYINLNVSGQQKLRPAITMKEHIWLKFSQRPQNANIDFLNNFIGVEVSHCTGNARRIKFKDLLCINGVRSRLSRCYHDWEITDWGREFATALEADDFDPMRKLWQTHREWQQDIGSLIGCMLESLYLTGKQGEYLVAAYFSDHSTDRHIEFKIKDNEWASCLRDSIAMATYAVIGDSCLKVQSRGAVTPFCSREPASTVFETRLHMRTRASKREYIQLRPTGGLFCVDKVRGNRLTITPASGKTAVRMLHAVTGAIEIVERMGRNVARKELSVLVKARSKSFGGLRTRKKRLHNPVDQPDSLDDIPLEIPQPPPAQQPQPQYFPPPLQHFPQHRLPSPPVQYRPPVPNQIPRASRKSKRDPGKRRPNHRHSEPCCTIL